MNQQQNVYPTVTHLSETVDSPTSTNSCGLTEAQLLSFYYNAELEDVDDFVDIFIKTTLDIPVNDEFYRMVAQYCDSCRRNEQLDVEISTVTSQWDTLRPTLWEQENRVITQRGKCGDGKLASGSYSVPVAKFDKNSMEKLQSTTNALNEIRFDKLASVVLETNFSRLQCQNHVQKCIHQFLTSFNVTPNHPSCVFFVRNVDSVQENTRNWIQHCVSVLFHFLREPSLPQAFVTDVKSWLCNLVGTLNRNAFPEDHVILLCHLLRCPQGTANWSKNFIQPLSQIQLFDSTPSVNHFLALLNVVLSPIRKREEYLKGYMQTEVENSWAIVDSDGDNEAHFVSVSESDLLSLLSQFSFDRMLFDFVINLTQAELTESRVLTLFAFELTVLKVLYEGLRTYNCTQYRQICKLIGLMLRKSVQCVSEFWQIARPKISSSSTHLQYEFDRLFLRAIYYIVSSRRLGVWQFLVDLHYDVVSPEFVLRIVYMLMTTENVTVADILSSSMETIQITLRDVRKLEQRLVELDETDAVYLLTALSNIACSSQDDNLVIPIVVQIFNACFVNDSTRPALHKSGRQLLSNIASRRLDIVYFCVNLIEENLNVVGGYALELMAALPLQYYRLEDKQWKVIKRWLDAPLQSLSNALAQQILLSLNWKFETNDGRLFLDYNLHKDVAVSIAKAHGVHCQIQSSMIGGSVKKAAKLASSVSGTINFAEQFDTFCWNLLLRLKLNPTDFNATTMESISSSNFQSDKFDLTSFYVSFQLNCLKTDRVSELLIHLEKLIENYQFKAAIACVCVAIPFLADEGVLLKDARWLQCIQSLIHCDDSYLPFAKQLIGNNFPGENLQLISSMISYTMTRFLGGNVSKAEKFYRYWLLLLCNGDLKHWSQDRSALFLIDSLIRHSFLFDPTLDTVTRLFCTVYEQYLSTVGRQNKGFFSKVFGDELPPEIFSQNQYSSAPWFAFVAIKAEEFIYAELFDALNVETLRQPSSALDLTFKKLCTKRGVAFPILRLPVFQWSTLFCSLDTSHVLFPLVLQQFLVHFLRLVKVADHSLPGVVFADKFQTVSPERIENLHKTLIDSIDSLKSTSNNNHREAGLLELCSAVKVWLNEKQLKNSSRNVLTMNLPMKILLESVCRGEKIFWLDYLDFNTLNADLWHNASAWIHLRHLELSKQMPMPTSPLSSMQNMQIVDSPDVTGRLLEKLKINCQPTDDAPPIVVVPADLFPTPDNTTLCDYRRLVQMIDPHMNVLTSAARSYMDIKLNVDRLNGEFFSLITKLYFEIDTQVAVVLKCQSSCLNPNKMKINTKCSKYDENCNRKLDENRLMYNNHASKIVHLMSKDVPSHAVSVISVIKAMSSTFCQTKNETDLYACLKLNAVELFFRCISQLDDRAMKFPATRITLVQCIDVLGQHFILGNPEQIEPMFNVLVSNVDLCGLLLPYFSPSCADSTVSYSLYGQLTETNISKQLWRSILQKFEISAILAKCNSIEVVEFFKTNIKGCKNSYKLGYESVFEVYRQHFALIAYWNFPQNFAKFVEYFLNENVCKQGPPVLMSDLVSKLTGSTGGSGQSEYVLLPYVGLELIPIVERVFTDLKKTCKLCNTTGLLHCCKFYASPLASMFRLCFFSTLQALDSNSSSLLNTEEKITKSFDLLRSLFGAWIEPNFKNGKTYPPWSHDDSDLANSTIFESFIACLIRLQQIYESRSIEILIVQTDILSPHSRNVCDLTLSYYMEKLINPNLSDAFVYNVQNVNLLKLSWQNYWPNLHIMNAMKQALLDLPQPIHCFITGIVVRIPWTNVAHSYDQQPVAAKSAFSGILLDIVVRCASNKANYTDCKASLPQLLNNLCKIRWDFVDIARLEDVLKFVSCTFGADSIFAAEDDIRRSILKLLEHVTEFLPLAPCQDDEQRLCRTKKRASFVRLLVQCLAEYCQTKSASIDFSARYVTDLIDRIELLIGMNDKSEYKTDECKQLLEEFISVWNSVEQIPLFEATQNALFSWLEAHPDADILLPLLNVSGRCLTNFQHVLSLQEKCITSYFSRANPKPVWSEIATNLYVRENFGPNYVQVCRNRSNLLSLYAYFIQKLSLGKELSDETIIIRDVLTVFDSLKEKQFSESHMVLYCGLMIDLIARQLQFGAHSDSVIILLQNFLDDLQNAVVEKSGGFLGAIGLSKKITYPPRFKLFVQLILSYMQQQIFVEREIRLSSDAAITNSRIQFVTSLKSNKQYAQSYSGPINLALEYLTNTENTFCHTSEFYSKLVLTLYNEKFLIDKCNL